MHSESFRSRFASFAAFAYANCDDDNAFDDHDSAQEPFVGLRPCIRRPEHHKTIPSNQFAFWSLRPPAAESSTSKFQPPDTNPTPNRCINHKHKPRAVENTTIARQRLRAAENFPHAATWCAQAVAPQRCRDKEYVPLLF